MFCENCGGELRQEENKLVCTKCGAVFSTESEVQAPSAEYVVPRGFSSKKFIIIIIVAALLLLGGVGAIVAVNVTKSNSQTALSGIEVAERYLSEQNYEQAIIEFEKILEIEPMNVEAYLGLAEAYIGIGDTEKALEILRKGLEQTGDARLQAKIDELTKVEEPVVSSGSSSSSSEPAESSSSSSTSSIPSKPAEQIYGDEECLAIEEMLEAYLRGDGEINNVMLKNITGLEIYGTEVVSVQCNNRHGTYINSVTHSEEKATLRTIDGEEIIVSRGKIDNIKEDLGFIFDTPLLKILKILYNQIDDITPLAGLTNLTALDLSDNKISDITPLAGLTNLIILYLHNNEISDITPLAGFINLTDLGLWNNTIIDITPLAGLKKLGSLDLRVNQITDITPLAGLTNLKNLYLSHNKISDIIPLAWLTNLTYLNLINNQVSEADQAWLKEKLPNCIINF